MKTSKRNKITNGRQNFCSYSHKRTAGREVVLAEYAVMYVKQLGFLVLPGFGQKLENLKYLNAIEQEIEVQSGH